MLVAIVGTYDDTKIGSIRGNGKTLSAVFLAYRDYLKGRKIYTNFYTSFSKTVTLDELYKLFTNKGLDNVTIVIDEAQLYLPNMGVKAKIVKSLVNLFIAQTRKRNVDVILTTQRYLNLHKQLRMQVDVVLVPVKYHLMPDGSLGSLCMLDSCKEEHAIIIYNTITEEFLPYSLIPSVVGKMYNSDEIVLDEFLGKV